MPIKQILSSFAPLLKLKPVVKPKVKGKSERKKAIQPKRAADRAAQLLADMSSSSSDSDGQRGSWFYFSLFSSSRSPDKMKKFVRKINRLSKRCLDKSDREKLEKALNSFEDRLCLHYQEISNDLQRIREKIAKRLESMDNLILPTCKRRYPYIYLGNKLVSLRYLAKKEFDDCIGEYQVLKRRYGAHCLSLSGVRFVVKELCALLIESR